MSDERKMGTGQRFNSGKLDLNYCPLSTKIAVATVFAANSKKNGGKYDDNNWRYGQLWSVPLASAMRHLEKFLAGENIDEETGLPHLWLVQTNMAMLIEYSQTYPEGDDRVKNKVPVADYTEQLEYYKKALEKNNERKII